MLLLILHNRGVHFKKNNVASSHVSSKVTLNLRDGLHPHNPYRLWSGGIDPSRDTTIPYFWIAAGEETGLTSAKAPETSLLVKG